MASFSDPGSDPGMLDPAVPIAALRPRLSGVAAVEARLRLVLETRPGRLPWRPKFGCDLAALIGEPSSPQNLSRARLHVEQAIALWLPDLKILRLDVQIRPLRPQPSGPAAPPGEGAMLSLGAQAVLAITLEVLTASGPIHLSTDLSP